MGPPRWRHALAVLLVALVRVAVAQDPMSHNGGSALAMCGRDAVVLLLDGRGGAGNLLIARRRRPVLRVGRGVLMGVCGLDTDIETLLDDVVPKLRLAAARDGVSLGGPVVSRIVGNYQYERRARHLHCECLVAGVGAQGPPYLCSMDVLGAHVVTDDFAVAGTAATSLRGLCEAYFRPGMGTRTLVRTARRCFDAAMERDCLSGDGSYMFVITRDGIFERRLDEPHAAMN